MDVAGPLADAVGPPGIVVCDGAGRIRRADPRVAELLGRPQLAGLPWEGIRFANGEPFGLSGPWPRSEYRRVALLGGRTRGVLVNGARRGDDLVLAVAPVERSLLPLADIPDGVAAADHRDVVVFANAPLEHLLGLPFTRLVDRPLQALGGLLTGRRLGAFTLRTAIAEGRPLALAVNARLADGRRRALFLHTIPWTYRGCRCGTLWFVCDFGAVAAGRRASGGAVAASRLSARLQHELRNPLQTMQAAVDILRPLVPSGGQHALQLLEGQIETVLDYLGDPVLAGAKPGPLRVGRGLLSAVVAEEVDRATLRPATARLSFRHRPPSEEPAVVLEPVSMGRVFANLFRNTARVRPDARVEIDYTVGQRVVVCRVTDDGPGFPDDMVRPGWFAQHPARRRHLGLALAAESLRAQGGSIEIRNVNGRGAQVELTLRCSEPAAGPGGGSGGRLASKEAAAAVEPG